MESKVKIENIDSVSFGNAIIHTMLTAGLDGNAPDEHKRDIKLSFELSDDTDVKEFLMERLAAALRIKCNQKDEKRFKGHPHVKSYEDFARLIDEEYDGEYYFSEEELIELLTPTRTTQESMSKVDWVWHQYKNDEINEDQRDQMLEILGEKVPA